MEHHVKAAAKAAAKPITEDYAGSSDRRQRIAEVSSDKAVIDASPAGDKYFPKKIAALAQGLTEDPQYLALEKAALDAAAKDGKPTKESEAANAKKDAYISKEVAKLGLPAEEGNNLVGAMLAYTAVAPIVAPAPAKQSAKHAR